MSIKNYLNEFRVITGFLLILDYWCNMGIKANIAIAQMQDFIGLGEEGRMNAPSTLGKIGNGGSMKIYYRWIMW